MDEITVFFRDDDVGPLIDPLRRVTGLLLEASVPCSYQVVPTQLSDESADWIRALKQAHGELVYLNQHGYRHEQELAGERAFSEFAGRRAYDDQFADLSAGRALLEERLGAALDGDVFTPPCHKYDDDTLRALQALGFTTLSAGVKADPLARLYYGLGRALGRVSWLGGRVSYHGSRTPGTELAEVSVCIDVDEAIDPRGEKIEKDLDGLWAEFEACSAVLPVVGVMLHHARYEQPSRLETLRAFVQRLKDDPRVRFAALPRIAAMAAAH